MDIEGLGEKQVALLQERGLLRTAADFYRLSEQQLTELEGFGEMSARKVLAAIEASKQRPFARVLFALGIEEVGEVTARNLVQRLRDIDALLAASPQELAETPGVGEKMAELDPRPAAGRAHARADRASCASSGCASRRAGPAPARGPARRQDARADRARCPCSRASRRPSGSWPRADA